MQPIGLRKRLAPMDGLRRAGVEATLQLDAIRSIEVEEVADHAPIWKTLALLYQGNKSELLKSALQRPQVVGPLRSPAEKVVGLARIQDLGVHGERDQRTSAHFSPRKSRLRHGELR